MSPKPSKFRSDRVSVRSIFGPVDFRLIERIIEEKIPFWRNWPWILSTAKSKIHFNRFSWYKMTVHFPWWSNSFEQFLNGDKWLTLNGFCGPRWRPKISVRQWNRSLFGGTEIEPIFEPISHQIGENFVTSQTWNEWETTVIIYHGLIVNMPNDLGDVWTWHL